MLYSPPVLLIFSFDHTALLSAHVIFPLPDGKCREDQCMPPLLLTIKIVLEGASHYIKTCQTFKFLLLDL